MKRLIILGLLVVLAASEAFADIGPMPQLSANQACRNAITAAERAYGIPPRLLSAIARVESGRRDQASGTFNPWPWTINFDGQGSFYESKAQAVAAAFSMRPRATRSVDVGCLQISLTQHPDAFASLDQAFDPMANADYAARFLLQLFSKSGSWPKAVELYHSATPEIGLDYRQKVFAALPEERRLADATAPSPLANAWAASSTTRTFSGPMLSFRPPPVRVIPHTSITGGDGMPGRDLASYRALSGRFASRMQ